MNVLPGRGTLGVMTYRNNDDQSPDNGENHDAAAASENAIEENTRPRRQWKKWARNGALAVLAAAAVGALILLSRNTGDDNQPFADIPDALEDNRESYDPIQVSGHYRRLPDGWQASERKIAEAAERGLSIPGGYTYVDPYERAA